MLERKNRIRKKSGSKLEEFKRGRGMKRKERKKECGRERNRERGAGEREGRSKEWVMKKIAKERKMNFEKGKWEKKKERKA